MSILLNGVEQKPMIEIKLQRAKWTYDPGKLIGPEGGFGRVFRGKSQDGADVAIKQLKIGAEESAHRELRIAAELEGRTFQHVIPVFDSGEDPNTGSYYIVMPIADGSLQGRLDEGLQATEEEAIEIINQIVRGLAEVDGLVHRDLKPGNVLLHDGRWKIADFGIARFIEESTSLHTLKDCLSPQYAAPEQWKYEHSTAATDLYAVGCIAYRLVTGSLPFKGPAPADYKDQHLNKQPPPIGEDKIPLLRTVINMLLRKPPEARPDLKRVREILAKLEVQSFSAPSRVSEAAARLAQKRAEEEAAHAATRAKLQRRDELAASAQLSLGAILDGLRACILEEAPIAEAKSSHIKMGHAVLTARQSGSEIIAAIADGYLSYSGFDVLLHTRLELRQQQPPYEWSTTLFYGKKDGTDDYRWHEVGFMSVFQPADFAPFALDPTHEFAKSLGPGVHRFQPAFGPVPIDDEDEPAFRERWLTLFALAAEGKLRYPNRLPLDGNFWNRLSVYGIQT